MTLVNVTTNTRPTDGWHSGNRLARRSPRTVGGKAYATTIDAIDPGFSNRFWRVVRKTRGCWLWEGRTTKSGYGALWVPALRKMVSAHRMAWILTHGLVPAGLEVCHRCDQRSCCKPSCLWLGTHLENMRDMQAKGRRSPHAHARKGRKFSAEHRAALSVAQCRRYARKRQVA